MSLTLDDSLVANEPGCIRPNYFHYARYFPLWPCVLTGTVMTGVALTVMWSFHVLWVTISFAAFVTLYFSRVYDHFVHGSINPAMVLSAKPLMLAVYTNLSISEGDFPVIKVVKHPSLRGDRFEPGQRCVTISLYRPKEDSRHWKDFDPKLVEAATGDRAAIDIAMMRISDDEWVALEKAIADLPAPLKPGLYRLPSTSWNT